METHWSPTTVAIASGGVAGCTIVACTMGGAALLFSQVVTIPTVITATSSTLLTTVSVFATNALGLTLSPTVAGMSLAVCAAILAILVVAAIAFSVQQVRLTVQARGQASPPPQTPPKEPATGPALTPEQLHQQADKEQALRNANLQFYSSPPRSTTRIDDEYTSSFQIDKDLGTTIARLFDKDMTVRPTDENGSSRRGSLASKLIARICNKQPPSVLVQGTLDSKTNEPRQAELEVPLLRKKGLSEYALKLPSGELLPLKISDWGAQSNRTTSQHWELRLALVNALFANPPPAS